MDDRNNRRAARPCAQSLESRVLLASAASPVAPLGALPTSDAVAFRGAYYFFATPEAGTAQLWKTDGLSEAGTSLVATVRSFDPAMPVTYSPAQRYEPTTIAVAGDLMYFIALAPGDGRERALWQSDGTAAGTRPITDPTGADSVSVFSDHLVELGGHAFFVGDRGLSGQEVFRTDPGAPGGAKLLADAWPGYDGSQPRALQVTGGRLYFTADTYSPDLGPLKHTRLWQSDGTPAGTSPVAEVGGEWEPAPPVAEQVVAAGDVLFYVARTYNEGKVLWRLDLDHGVPVAGSRRMLKATPTAAGMTALDGGVVFGHSSFQAYELWKSDGTVDGTGPFFDLAPHASFGGPDAGTDGGFVPQGDALLFFHHGVLWRTDGTAGGTSKLGLFPNAAGAALPWGTQLRPANGQFVFTAVDGASGAALFVTDGTAGGTRAIQGLPNPAGRLLGEVAGGLLLSTTDGTGGAAPLARVDDVAAAPLPANRAPFADAGGGLRGYYFQPDARTVRLDATGSFDPDGDGLTFGWDLNGDDDFTDSAGPTVDVTWAQLQLLSVDARGDARVRVRVTDARGATTDSPYARLVLDRPRADVIEARPASTHGGQFIALPDGAGAYAFQLSFGPYALDVVTLEDADVRVTGPGGFDVPATFVAVDGNQLGATPTVTYRFAAPGGSSDLPPPGKYRVQFPAGSLLDVEGNTTFAYFTDVQAMLETQPPTAQLTVAPPPNADQVYELAVTYADDTALDPATLDDSAVTLRRPVPNSATFDDIQVLSQVLGKAQQPDGSWVVTYQIYGTWANESLLFGDGTYAVWSDTYPERIVRDVSGNALPSVELGRFDVHLPRGGPDVWLTDVRMSLPKRPERGGRGKATFGLAAVTRGFFEEAPPPVPPVDVAVYLTTHLRPLPGDPVLATLPARAPGTEDHPNPLRVGFKLPGGLPPGQYHVALVADAAGALDEPNEANNRETASYTLLEPYVSLRMKPLEMKKPPRRGRVATVVLELSNFGTVAADGTATLTVTLTRPTGAPLQTRSSLRLRLAPQGARPATTRIRLRLPDDWPTGMSTLQVVLEPDANLAAIDRGGGATGTKTIEVVE